VQDIYKVIITAGYIHTCTHLAMHGMQIADQIMSLNCWRTSLSMPVTYSVHSQQRVSMTRRYA